MGKNIIIRLFQLVTNFFNNFLTNLVVHHYRYLIYLSKSNEFWWLWIEISIFKNTFSPSKRSPSRSISSSGCVCWWPYIRRTRRRPDLGRSCRTRPRPLERRLKWSSNEEPWCRVRWGTRFADNPWRIDYIRGRLLRPIERKEIDNWKWPNAEGSSKKAN